MIPITFQHVRSVQGYVGINLEPQHGYTPWSVSYQETVLLLYYRGKFDALAPTVSISVLT